MFTWSSEHAQAYFGKSVVLPCDIIYFITLKHFCISIRGKTAFAITACCVKIIKILETMNILLYYFILSIIMPTVLGCHQSNRGACNVRILATSNEFTSLINYCEAVRPLGGGFVISSERGRRKLLDRELMISLQYSDHTLIYQKKILMLVTASRNSILNK